MIGIKKFLLPVFVLILLFPLVFSFSGETYAQGTNEGQVSVSITPREPGPNQNTTIKLISFAIDLDKATITWSLNGTRALSGVGEKSFSFTTGAVGTLSRVSVSISSPSISTINKSFSINPGEIALIWEAVGAYTPAFYKGKSLPTSQTGIKIVAIPNIKSGGVKIKPENLVYKWKKNDTTNQTNSGFGKNTFQVNSGYTDSFEKIEVGVTTLDGGINATTQMFIPISNPFVLLYEDKPLEGIYYERVLPSQLTLGNEEVKIVAEPYYFSSTDSSKNMFNFSWLVNDKEATGDTANQDTITLRTQNGVSGVSKVALSIKNKTRLLQGADTSFFVKFGTAQ